MTKLKDVKWVTKRCSCCRAWIAVPPADDLTSARKEVNRELAKLSPDFAAQLAAGDMCSFCAYLHGQQFILDGPQVEALPKEVEMVVHDCLRRGVTVAIPFPPNKGDYDLVIRTEEGGWQTVKVVNEAV